MTVAATPQELITPGWYPLRYHPTQAALWATRARFVAVPAGRGSGKTELARRRLVRYLSVKKPWEDARYFYGAPTLPQAKRIAWSPLLALIPKEWIADISYASLVIKTVFGSELHVVGLDRPQRVEGVQWDGCVLDESCDLKPGMFDLNILPALVWRTGWCWRIGVPKRFGVGAGEYRDFYERASVNQVREAMGYTWPSGDILPPEALRYARENMDQKDYDEQFNARFVTAAGGIFYAFDEEYNVRPCTYRPERPIIVGSDFNVDPMSWILCHRKDDRLEVFDEIWLRDANTPGTLSVLHGRYGQHKGGFEFYGDATSKARKTSAVISDYYHIATDKRFITLGRSLHYLHSNPPQADRFASTNALICNAEGARRLHIDPRCKRLIHDLKTRVYKQGTREADDAGDVGHATDALGYIVYKLFPIRIQIEGTGHEITVSGGPRYNDVLPPRRSP